MSFIGCASCTEEPSTGFTSGMMARLPCCIHGMLLSASACESYYCEESAGLPIIHTGSVPMRTRCRRFPLNMYVNAALLHMDMACCGVVSVHRNRQMYELLDVQHVSSFSCRYIFCAWEVLSSYHSKKGMLTTRPTLLTSRRFLRLVKPVSLCG